MNELSRHIEVLLLTNDCVVLPGLGGFVAHYVPAKYSEDENVFLPPMRTLGFNPQLTLNDSLLVQSYASTYDMSYPEALRRVEADVATLKNSLSEKGEYLIHGVGTLSVNSDGSIVFEPFASGLLTPSLYALNLLECKRLSSVEETASVSEAIGAPTHKGRVIYIDKDGDSGHAMLNIRVSALRQVAVAAMVAVLFVLAINTDFTPGPQVEKYKSGVLSFLYSSRSCINDIAVSKKPAAEPVKAVVKEEISNNNPYWTVVLCSHVSNKNAEAFNDQLHKDGIDSFVYPGSNSNAKVFCGRYSSEEEAYKALRLNKDNKHFAQGWVMQVKPDSAL